MVVTGPLWGTRSASWVSLVGVSVGQLHVTPCCSDCSPHPCPPAPGPERWAVSSVEPRPLCLLTQSPRWGHSSEPSTGPECPQGPCSTLRSPPPPVHGGNWGPVGNQVPWLLGGRGGIPTREPPSSPHTWVPRWLLCLLPGALGFPSLTQPCLDS